MYYLQDELNRLRIKMTSEDYSLSSIQDQLRVIEDEVRIQVYKATEEALRSAKEQGKKSEEFVNEVRAVKIGDYFEIMTDSGREDFSIPPFPMLNNLLKNAKIAKDGSKYKVIPIAEKSSIQSDNLQNRPKQHVSSNITFKTASSKQDINTQWVHPGINMDMSSLLEEVNYQLKQDITNIIDTVISMYEREI